VYGIPCDVEKIKKIAAKYEIKVIYDAAHTFGGKYKGKSIVSYGDISTLSFHATKLFHTVEGGAIITDNEKVANRISYMRNFGHKGQEDFWGLGINGKNSEFHAAMGLCIMPFTNELISSRKRISVIYNELLRESNIVFPVLPEGTEYNYSYYPIIIKSETLLLSIRDELNKIGIYPRRYFYPSLDQLPYIKVDKKIISNDISKRVLCLPLYSELDFGNIKMITQKILEINSKF
jgi:dTDP-4-amino-4,6-dideoxygalactose transaminase